MKEISVICVIKPQIDELLRRKNYENYGNLFPFLLGILSGLPRLHEVLKIRKIFDKCRCEKRLLLRFSAHGGKNGRFWRYS